MLKLIVKVKEHTYLGYMVGYKKIVYSMHTGKRQYKEGDGGDGRDMGKRKQKIEDRLSEKTIPF